MSNVLGELFGDIADAIREKTGDTATMKPAEFPDKISGIEVGGGAGVDPYYMNLAEAVIQRSATPLSGDPTTLSLRGFKFSGGNTLARMPSYALAGFNKVESITVNDTFLVDPYAFRDCTKLKILDLTVAATVPYATFLGGSLDGCSALEAVIIRDGGGGVANATFLSTDTTGNNYGGVGANDTFYVYVPAADYDTVVATVNNSSNVAIPASRYRKLEDYPAINFWNKTFTVNFYDGDKLVDTKTVKYGQSTSSSYNKSGYTLVGWNPSPVNVTENMDCYGSWVPATFNDASWSEIIDLANEGRLTDFYDIGDEKELALNYADGTSETVTIVLANANCEFWGPTGGSATANAVLFTKTPVMKSTYKMTSGSGRPAENYSGGVKDALNTTILEALPPELASAAKARYRNIGNPLWIPSNADTNPSASTGSNIIPLAAALFDGDERLLYQHGTNTPVDWWLCDYRTSGNYYFYSHVNASGSYVSMESSNSTPHYIAFGICI